MRRRLTTLTNNILKANSKKAKALAYYRLGLFHDNNGREKKAIPNYIKAIEIGLTKEMEAKARAWLASSLYKTDQSQEALKEVNNASKIAKNPKLFRFLARLEKRIISKV